jgi:putative FmdB family regulatory protein
MPIFEFECEVCGHITEKLVFGDGTEVVCEACGSTSMNKVMSTSSSLTGSQKSSIPGPGDTACCGGTPGQSGCIPGSCCGKAGV